MRALTMTPLRRTVLRSALGGFAIGTAALLALAPGQAQVFGGHNSDAPVSVSADHGELLGRQDRATLAGNVVISQGDLSYLVQSPFAIVAYLAMLVFLALGYFLKNRQQRMESQQLVPLTTPIDVAALEAEEALVSDRRQRD